MGDKGDSRSGPVTPAAGGNGRYAAVDVRHNCGRLLLRGYFAHGTHFVIRCPRCGKLYVFGAEPKAPPEMSPETILTSVANV